MYKKFLGFVHISTSIKTKVKQMKPKCIRIDTKWDDKRTFGGFPMNYNPFLTSLGSRHKVKQTLEEFCRSWRRWKYYQKKGKVMCTYMTILMQWYGKGKKKPSFAYLFAYLSSFAEIKREAFVKLKLALTHIEKCVSLVS